MPERISHAPSRSFGRISISKSLYKFAIITSLCSAGFHLSTSHNSKLAPRILFNRAFDLATEIAAGSLSIPVTWPAPKHFAAKARIPLPVPRSVSDQPRFQQRVSCSKKRSDIAVVACSPVPNANEAGMTRWERPLCRDTKVPPTLETTIRLPILIAFESARANRSSQLRGKASIRPPNSLSNADESLRERHTISNSRRLRPGLPTITSWPKACA